MIVLLLLLLLIVLPHTQAAEPPVPGTIDFNRDVRPILTENCIACHGPDAAHRQADLRLDLRDEAIQAAAIVPGDPVASSLMQRILSTDADLRMPPAETKKSLTPKQQETLQRWIAQGAEYQGHWAFERPQKVTPPAIPDVSHPIDQFLQARLAADNLTPSRLADPQTLIRRVCLDLTGLPPSVEEIDAFLSDFQNDPETAWKELVDRLLVSPHYGERWGRWWLDQARYADSNGYSIDGPRQIWAFRDWVISALNCDLPFDQFTLEQLAGDMLPEATEQQRVATGFHRNTQINQEGGIDREQFRIDSVFDRVATTGTVWLGLTIGCAQCHDHKFDPITQHEYYQLFAFFNNQDEPTLRLYGPEVDPAELQSERRVIEEQLTQLLADRQGQIQEWAIGLSAESRGQLPPPVLSALETAPQKRSLPQLRLLYSAAAGESDANFDERNARLTQLEKQLGSGPTTLVLQERTEPRRTTVFIKGDFTRPADEVHPGTPQLLHPFKNRTGQSTRIDLAEWLTSRENPLTSRVIVNRIWQQYFGRGLVETENDFGTQGTLPSHPQLLDHLAVQLMDDGWRLKELHRLIVTSHAYRQSSEVRSELHRGDPHNYLLGRQNRLRLDAEIIRDVALSASGLLSRKMGGPPVYPPIPDGVMGQGQVKHAWNVSTGDDRYRRGCYTFVFRASPPPALNVFDAPDGYSTCTRRLRSNTPLQALTLLNDATSVEFARKLESIIRESGVETAFRRCTSRRPAPEELEVLKTLDSTSAARVLLNLDETITRE